MGKREHSASTSRIGVRRNSYTGSTISTSTITSARSLSNLDDRRKHKELTFTASAPNDH